MNKKENTPLIVLKSLEPYLGKSGTYFLTDNSQGDLIRFKGNSLNSEFFFHIKSTKINNHKHQIEIEYKPYSDQDINPRKSWINCDSIEPYFKTWTNLLEQYATTKTPFDDPIIQSYYEEYFSDFEIVDEEKDKPINQKIIRPLYEHFEDIKLRLEEYKNDANQDEIEDIQSEISELNSELTNKGRQWIATKISTIWAKLTKMGVKYFIEFVEFSRKELFKVGVSKMFELAEKGMDFIQDIDKIG